MLKAIDFVKENYNPWFTIPMFNGTFSDNFIHKIKASHAIYYDLQLTEL